MIYADVLIGLWTGWRKILSASHCAIHDDTMTIRNLEYVFRPKSIAVFGASLDSGRHNVSGPEVANAEEPRAGYGMPESYL